MSAGRGMNAGTGAPPSRRRRVLFMAEAVTLAHVARPHVLANALPAKHYEVLFACDPRYNALFADAQYRRQPLHSVSSERFLKSLSKGSPLYDFATLQRYVEDDLAVIDEFQPDVIVGDFRLSLSTSARLRQVPYVAITNAYWSPHLALPCPVPELPLTRLLGYRVGGALFRCVIPIGFALHARAHNQLRRHHGMAPLGADVRRYYTDGDVVLYADPPGLIPLRSQPQHHQFFGPIQWSPKTTPPGWWSEVCGRPGPIIYVTLGSSGDSRLLPQVVEGLAAMAGTVLVATAGRREPIAPRDNVLVADYLPGEDAAALADLVVCNGGSPTTYQALAAGKPVLGIPSNLDQCLNMAVISARGLGRVIRARGLTTQRVRVAASEELSSGLAQRELAMAWREPEDGQRFANVLEPLWDGGAPRQGGTPTERHAGALRR